MRKLYFSPLGVVVSILTNIRSLLRKPFMIYGFYNQIDKNFYKRTRIASTCVMNYKNKIDLKNNVWIGHYSLLDGVGGIVIKEGVHIASHTCIYTHSSQDSIRILGKKYMEFRDTERLAYRTNSVEIGEYTFVGTSSIILSGTKIGKGCIIGAGSLLNGTYPDYSYIKGSPAKVVEDTRNIDRDMFVSGIDFSNYYDRSLAEQFKTANLENSWDKIRV